MTELIDLLAHDSPEAPLWEQFRAIDYPGDVSKLKEWIPTVLERDPPESRMDGLWFGIVYPTSNSGTTADLVFRGTSFYDKDDGDYLWVDSANYQPPHSYAHSRSLDAIYKIVSANRSNEPSPLNAVVDFAEWGLILGASCLIVRNILVPDTLQALSHEGTPVGVLVGYTDGDTIKIGNYVDNVWVGGAGDITELSI